MGGGASSTHSNANQAGLLEEAITRVEAVPPGARLSGVDVEKLVGVDLFDPNAFGVLANASNLVVREELLRVMQVNQVFQNTEATVRGPTLTDAEADAAATAARNRALSMARQPEEEAERRGALSPWSTAKAVQQQTYRPSTPPGADSRTVLYPYASIMVVLFQLRDDGGWNIVLFRNRITGEWGSVAATFAGRHAVASSRPNGLRQVGSLESRNNMVCCRPTYPRPQARPSVSRAAAC